MELKKLFKFKFNNRILIIAASVVMLLALLAVGLSSCSRDGIYQKALDNLAEARFYMKLSDENPNLKVQFFSGMREEPYNINGTAEKTQGFGIINIEPVAGSKILDNFVELKGELKIGDEAPITVTLDKNPYDSNFACDIARLVEADKTIVFTLQLDDSTHMVFNLINCMPDNAISWERALEIATESLTAELKAAGSFETYVKIVHDLVKGTGSFWYIQFVTASGESIFCVLDHAGSIVG